MVDKNNMTRYKGDYERLCELGISLQLGFMFENREDVRFISSYNELNEKQKAAGKKYCFSMFYHGWYNEGLRLIKQLMPERLEDFIHCYSTVKKKDMSVTIEDYLVNASFRTSDNTVHGAPMAYAKFNQQLMIILSLKNCFESSLFNIKELLQADVFDSELDGARELHKNGFYRAAGALCGVIIEKHFAGVVASHSIKMKSKAPGISDYNEKLKDEGVIENKTYLLVQRLGAIRNLCDHNKKQEPTKDDIDDLIRGTDKVLHEVM